ncbi:MAG: PQQ-binding-like beta-propeller repeat protein, partial [Acidimicrobiia bacterium]
TDLVGSAEHRGGFGRSGVVENQGIRSVSGHYWVYETEGPIVAAPVAYGQWVLVGSTSGTFYALNMTDKSVLWTMDTGGVSATPAVALAQLGEGSNEATVVVADDDGLVQARAIARDALTTVQWRESLGAGILSSPVIADGRVLVATADDPGSVHALDLFNGDPIWVYPTDGDPSMGRVSADLAYADGVLYVGGEDGLLYLIDAASGELICSKDFGAPIVANPVVVDGVVYVPTEGNQIHVRPAGACEGTVENRLPFYLTEVPVSVAPAIVGDAMYLPSGVFLYKIDLTESTPSEDRHLWPASTVTAARTISSSPVVAGDTVIIGSGDGLVRAVDATSGETLWEWQTGQSVRGSPAVIEGAVFIASADGKVYAVGE